MQRFISLLFGCGMIIGMVTAAAGGDQDATIRTGGSTTLLPIMANCSSEFMEKYQTWDRVDASMPKTSTTVFVTGGGSGFGVKALLSGVIDIGMVSRDLKDQACGDFFRRCQKLPGPRPFTAGQTDRAFDPRRERRLDGDFSREDHGRKENFTQGAAAAVPRGASGKTPE